uniref:Minor capsid protein VP2 n=2 Tax=Miniopterus schreibersii polyomavirus 1 TaxID=1904408 RepID=A0A1S7J003_9POLY|nr:VP2 protein [Miniopterus schreibersii polyomavirus 1]
MGGVLSTVVEMITMAVELSAATGIAMDALLTGEALAALEAEVTSLMTIQGLSAFEALAQLGWTAEQFSNMAFISTTFSQAIGYGVMFQTVTGISGLVQAGIRLGLNVASSSRGTQVAQLERDFGKIVETLHVNLSHQMNPLNWCASLHEEFPPSIQHLPISLRHQFADLLKLGRWVNQHHFTTNPAFESGDVIRRFEAPGGAFQDVAPDWLVNLILRLHDGAEEATPFYSSLSS